MCIYCQTDPKLSQLSCFISTCRPAMLNCVVLVVIVMATLTTAKDGLLTSVGELEAVKDNNGVAQCVTSPSNKTVTARSKIDCMRVCISEGCSCAYGANYHSDDRRCELHSEPPGSLEHVPNCVYYQVLTWLITTQTPSNWAHKVNVTTELKTALGNFFAPQQQMYNGLAGGQVHTIR